MRAGATWTEAYSILEGDKFCRGHQRQQTIRRLPSAPAASNGFFRPRSG